MGSLYELLSIHRHVKQLNAWLGGFEYQKGDPTGNFNWFVTYHAIYHTLLVLKKQASKAVKMENDNDVVIVMMMVGNILVYVADEMYYY